jgi:hypothetical protein
MKRNLKPPGTEHLILKCDDPLSNVAFNFNLRRYTKAVEMASVNTSMAVWHAYIVRHVILCE